MAISETNIHTHLWYTSHHKYNRPRSIYIQTQNIDDGSITWPLHTHTRIPNTQESLTVLQPRWSINDRSLGHSLWNAVNSLGCNATVLFNCHSLRPVLYHSEQAQHTSTYLQCIAGMLTTKKQYIQFTDITTMSTWMAFFDMNQRRVTRVSSCPTGSIPAPVPDENFLTHVHFYGQMSPSQQ